MRGILRRIPDVERAIVPHDRRSFSVCHRPARRQLIRGVILCLVITATLAGCARVRNILVDPTNASQRLMEQARNAANSREYEQAHGLLDRANDLNPSDPEVHRLQARLYLEQQKTNEAIEQLRAVVELDTDDVTSRVQLAHLLADAGFHEEAAKPLRNALELNPSHVDALLLRARLAEQTGKRELAMETLHRVLGCDAEQVDAKLRLAKLQIDSGHADRAAPLLRSIGECPFSKPAQRGEAHWSLGLIYGSEKRWSDAAREFTLACQFKNDLTADDWYRVAYADFQAEDYNGAKQAVTKCLAINNRHEAALELSVSFEAYGLGSPSSVTQPIVPIGYTASSIPVPEGW